MKERERERDHTFKKKITASKKNFARYLKRKFKKI